MNVLWLKKTFDDRIISVMSVIVYAPLGQITMVNSLQSFEDFAIHVQTWNHNKSDLIWFSPINDFSNLKHEVIF